MCDRCVGGLKDDVIRGVFYGILKKVLNMGPLRKGVEVVDKTVEAVVPVSSSASKEGKERGIAKVMVVYIAASWFYENVLYKFISGMDMKIPVDQFGICPCEFMRNVYLIVILQIYDSYMHGFRLHHLLTDFVAVFGADYVNKLIAMIPQFNMNKKKSLIAPAPTSMESVQVATPLQDTSLVTKKLI